MSEPAKPRLCVDCKHYGGAYGGGSHRCYCPALAPLDLVTGNLDPVECKYQRQSWSGSQIALQLQSGAVRCGPEGRYWEQATGPRPTGRPEWVKAYWKDQGWKPE